IGPMRTIATISPANIMSEIEILQQENRRIIRENNELRQQLLRNQEEWTSKQTEYENKIRLLDDQISELNFTKQRLIQQNQSNEKDIDQLKNHINSILSKENVWIENGELKKQQISISKLLTTSHDSIISSDNQV